MSKKVIWLIVAVLVVVAIGSFFIFSQNKSDQNTSKSIVIDDTTPEAKTITFGAPKKSAHYEANVPSHGAVLAGAPVNVVVDFNFDLAQGSSISLKMSEKEYGVGETIIDPGKLAMRKKMDSSSPNGLYDVSYRACWADGSCHEGSFQFAVDRSLAEKFSDMRGKTEISIVLENFKFSPQEVRISRGTKVTWTNKDSAIHTVNTDSHPFHTYYLSQNSRDLKQGETYSVVFDEPGIYPYHCTPHAKIMTGTLLVE